VSLPLQSTTHNECALCDADHVHCHGTAIVSGDSNHVCSEDSDCTLSIDEHRFVSLDEV
jgi:hypothetical protein